MQIIYYMLALIVCVVFSLGAMSFAILGLAVWFAICFKPFLALADQIKVWTGQ